MNESFRVAVRACDDRIEARRLSIWIGAEPTFTDADLLTDEWNTAALGPTKEARARKVLARYVAGRPQVMVLRSVGRQYGAEDHPRWSYGLWARRDERVVWDGPSDPSLAAGQEIEPALLLSVREAIAHGFSELGYAVDTLEANHDLRIVVREQGVVCDLRDPRLLEPSLHDVKAPESGLVDELAQEHRIWLFRIREEALESGLGAVRIELPDLYDVPTFERVMGIIGEALQPLALTSVVLAGYPPPTDSSVTHATVTPDPAVIEINMAPHSNLVDFYEDWTAWHAAAEAEGLSSRRLFYNGDMSDSGGGGQITFGGPSTKDSPFFVEPCLLPRLVVYANQHPSLSYLFAVDNVGPWSQSARADENLPHMFREFRLALARLEHEPELLSRDKIQAFMGPYLRDLTGNPHRAEINVEKLWNDALPGRGKLGLVEFRAFRMAKSPERAAAVACLLRSVIARLMVADLQLVPVDWGDTLHDRYGLPTCLVQDLEVVLADLRAHDLGLDEVIEQELLEHTDRVAGRVELGDSVLTIRRAVEVWPLVGDAGSQEQSTSRWIDASARRLELCIDGDEHDRLSIDGVMVPLHRETPTRFIGAVRHRAYVPLFGLHPDMPAHAEMEIVWWREDGREGRRIHLYCWKPDGSAYDGLPATDDAAFERRMERCGVTPLDAATVALHRAEVRPPPAAAVSGLTLDRRAWR